jgi:hypothetical protein
MAKIIAATEISRNCGVNIGVGLRIRFIVKGFCSSCKF